MAKKKAKVETKTINGADICQISEKSQDIVWTYGTGSTSLQFSYLTATNPKYNKEGSYPIFIRQGNDLVLLSIYRNKSDYSIKKITNTIKDYFSLSTEVPVTVKNGSIIYNAQDYLYADAKGYTWDTSSTKGNFFYGSKKNDSYHAGLAGGISILDEGGKDTYDIRSINAEEGNTIFDIKGNDKYYLASKKTGQHADGIYDYAGNDKYKVTNSTSVNVYDYKGNDGYEANNDSLARISDYKGNDKYTFDNTQKGSGATDYEGNDTYNVSNITTHQNFVNINDHKGNDKYKYENVSSDESKALTDNSGKDTYNISGSNYISIQDNSDSDKKRTDDTYNISNSSRIFIKEKSSESGKKIVSGNDTYNFNGVDNSSLTESEFIHQKSTAITDSAGNDKYNIKNSKDVGFDDKKGNDTWNVISSKNTIITDSDGKDKYNIVSSTSASDFKLTDNKGDDTWAIKGSKTIYAVDNNGADKYTISDYSIDIDITDNAGNDKYTIKDSIDVYIEDSGKSNDKYDINNYSSAYSYNRCVIDDGGNDSYNVNNSRNAYLINSGGNTTYTVNNSRSTIIEDYAFSKEVDANREKNTYNIKNSSATIISVNSANYDEGETEKLDTYISNDTYNVTSSKNAWMYDYDFGTDTYNIKSNQGGTIINDKGGNDSYTIDKLTNDFKITDGAGTDTLSLSKTKADNLVFMANYDLELEMTIAVKDASLYVFDKSTKGYIQINNFYSTKTDTFGRTTIKTDEKGTGYIENIIAGKKNVNSMVDTYTTGTTGENSNIYLLGQEINTWLDNKGYSANTYKTVDTILSSDIADEFLAFVSQYKPAS